MPEIVVGGISLVVIVLGLVAFIKTMGVTGRWLTVASMITGLIVGMAYQLSVKMPVTSMEWFTAVIYSLALGLVASGLYDEAVRLIAKSKADKPE